MRLKNSLTVFSGAVFLMFAGCGQTWYPDALGLSQEDLSEISSSDSLGPQQMRDALAAYGIDDVTINGLLSSVRLANQNGGDLASAYEKVVSGQLSTMTPDEVQLYGDATALTTYTDIEAQVIVDYFEDNAIKTIEDLEELLRTNADELPAIIDETNLRNVFNEASTTDVLNKL